MNASKEFYIVGASAGGLEAFEQFFHRIPDDSGMAFIVIHKGAAPMGEILCLSSPLKT